MLQEQVWILVQTGFTTVWTGPPCSTPAHTGGYTFTRDGTIYFSTPFNLGRNIDIIITVCYNDAGYGNDYGNLVAAYRRVLQILLTVVY